MKEIRTHVAVAALAVIGLLGCSTQPSAPAAATAPQKPAAAMATTASEYYVVLPEDGRYYAFGDFKTYASYLAHGEVALTRTKIGVGPNGKTVVFGITDNDVKANKPSTGELVFEGKLPADAAFYGEVFKDGRYYVFGNLADMKGFAAFGEVPYSFTDIGAGPKGETLVWVMNAESFKKGRPTATIERFKSVRTASR